MAINQQIIIDEMALAFPEVRIVHRVSQGYLTSQAMIDKGMKACEACGYIMPLEQRYCKCGCEVVAIASDKIKVFAPDYTVGQAPASHIYMYCYRCRKHRPEADFKSKHKKKKHNKKCCHCIANS